MLDDVLAVAGDVGLRSINVIQLRPTELGVDDMNERHLRPREARQLGTDISRMRRDGLVVDSNENFSKEHNSLPGPCRHA